MSRDKTSRGEARWDVRTKRKNLRKVSSVVLVNKLNHPHFTVRCLRCVVRAVFHVFVAQKGVAQRRLRLLLLMSLNIHLSGRPAGNGFTFVVINYLFPFTFKNALTTWTFAHKLCWDDCARLERTFQIMIIYRSAWLNLSKTSLCGREDNFWFHNVTLKIHSLAHFECRHIRCPNSFSAHSRIMVDVCCYLISFNDMLDSMIRLKRL